MNDQMNNQWKRGFKRMGKSWLTVMLVLAMFLSMVQVGSIQGVDLMPVAKANTTTPTVSEHNINGDGEHRRLHSFRKVQQHADFVARHS